eukprot:INCI14300.1.p1 GENE.INCI14300.1~~INCI14300.1.p1  ORF type:complete len:654 (+),score=188.04 INCI14300.1:193-2154(+)
MGQATSLTGPFESFNSWSVREVEELRKKYFLMDLNFGLGANDLKDWLDVDADTAGDMIRAFSGEGAERLSAMNLLAALVLCSRGEVEEKVQVVFACFDFEDQQKLDPASLGVLFLAAACGTFSLLNFQIEYPKKLVRSLVGSAIQKGAKDIHIGAFQKWCDEKVDGLAQLSAVDVITTLGFKRVKTDAETAAEAAEESKTESEASDVVAQDGGASGTDTNGTSASTGKGDKDPKKEDQSTTELESKTNDNASPDVSDTTGTTADGGDKATVPADDSSNPTVGTDVEPMDDTKAASQAETAESKPNESSDATSGGSAADVKAVETSTKEDTAATSDSKEQVENSGAAAVAGDDAPAGQTSMDNGKDAPSDSQDGAATALTPKTEGSPDKDSEGSGSVAKREATELVGDTKDSGTSSVDAEQVDAADATSAGAATITDTADAGTTDASDVNMPVAKAGDAGVAETGTKDSGVADNKVADAGAPDAGTADPGSTGASDVETHVAKAGDAGVAETGATDSSAADKKVADSGATDSGTANTSATVAGTTDVGTTDTGADNARATDAVADANTSTANSADAAAAARADAASADVDTKGAGSAEPVDNGPVADPGSQAKASSSDNPTPGADEGATSVAESAEVDNSDAIEVDNSDAIEVD